MQHEPPGTTTRNAALLHPNTARNSLSTCFSLVQHKQGPDSTNFTLLPSLPHTHTHTHTHTHVHISIATLTNYYKTMSRTMTTHTDTHVRHSITDTYTHRHIYTQAHTLSLSLSLSLSFSLFLSYFYLSLIPRTLPGRAFFTCISYISKQVTSTGANAFRSNSI